MNRVLFAFAALVVAATGCGGGGSKEASIGAGQGAPDLVIPAGTSATVPGTLQTDGILLQSASWRVQATTAGAPLPTLANDNCASATKDNWAPAAGGGKSNWQCDLVVIAPQVEQDSTYSLVLTGVDTRGQPHSVARALQITRSDQLNPARFATAAGSPFSVNAGHLGSLRCEADGAAWYQWAVSQAGGTSVTLSDSSGSEVFFTAPVVAAPTPITFECRMSVQNRVFTSQVTATVQPGSGATLALPRIDGTRFLIRNSSNPYSSTAAWFAPSGGAASGDAATYQWEFVAPLPAEVQLTNNGNGSASINVTGTPTIPVLLPLRVTATAGGQQSVARMGLILEPGGTTVPSVSPAAQTVTPGTKVTISATGQATAQRFAWASVSGPPVALAGANTKTVEFIAPSVATPTDIVLRVAVSHHNFSTQSPVAAFVDAVVRVAP
jgi:hypothetical protein